MLLKINTILLIILISSCNSPESHSINFYYWKTNFKLDALSKQTLSDKNSQKIYLRYLDLVSKNGRIIPNEMIRFSDTIPHDIEVVPVIYIKNQVMEQNESEINILAKRTLDLINEISIANNVKFNEVQLDCDWSLSTRDQYFLFIKSLKKIDTSVKISTTIRLHQVKYKEKTGVPPADKFVLMYYNIGELTNINENSIFNLKKSKLYSSYLNSYPQKFSFALPIFSWSVHFRDDKIVELINNSSSNDFVNNPKFKSLNKSLYQVVESHFYHGNYLIVGDIIKVEDISENDLNDIKLEIKSNYKYPVAEYIFYHLDSNCISKYDNSIFTKKM